MELLEYLVALRGVPAAVAGANEVAASQERIGLASRHVGEESGIAATRFGASMSLMKKAAIGLAVGGLAVAVGGFEAIKKSVEKTQTIAIAAASLSKVTGMNVNTAAQWMAVSDAYGISTRTLTMAFRSLSTQTSGAIGGTKSATAAFAKLGITTDELKAKSGNMSDLLGLVADHFNKMPGGAEKTALAVKLFGRGWQSLIPLLGEGSKGMKDLRDTAAAYGVTLGKDPLKNAQKLHEAEVKLKLAQTGLQVQIAEKLAPAFISAMNKALGLFKILAQSLGPAFKAISAVVKDASEWLSKHKDAAHALGVGLSVLVGVLVLVKLASIAVNLALLSSPIGWVILGIAALAAGLVYCWNHFKTFRDVVTGVWDWLKGAATDATQWVIAAFNNVVNFIAGMPDKISKLATGMWEGLKTGLTAVVNWIIGVINGVISSINSVSSSIPLIGGNVITPLGTIGGGGSGGSGGGGSGVGQANTAHGLVTVAPYVPKLVPKANVYVPPAGLAPRVAHAGLTIHATFDHPIVIDGHQVAHVVRRQVIKAMAANA